MVQAPSGRHERSLASFIVLVAGPGFVLSRGVPWVRPLVVVAGLLLGGLGCDPTQRKLSGTDCKPRKLARMQTCAGEDHGFQECGFSFRATGVPDKTWCEALTKQAPVAGPASRCDWAKPATWKSVACATYNVHGAARCFTCSDAQPEAAKTYVYAYDSSCSHGIEQVTCNVDPTRAGADLGPVTF